MPRKDTNGNEYIEVTYQGGLYHIPVEYIINEHPGGPAEIMDYEDKDMTEAFIDQGHSIDAEMELEQWHVKKGVPGVSDALEPNVTGTEPDVFTSAQREEDRKAETAAWRLQNTMTAVTCGAAAAAVALAVIVTLHRAHS